MCYQSNYRADKLCHLCLALPCHGFSLQVSWLCCSVAYVKPTTRTTTCPRSLKLGQRRQVDHARMCLSSCHQSLIECLYFMLPWLSRVGLETLMSVRSESVVNDLVNEYTRANPKFIHVMIGFWCTWTNRHRERYTCTYTHTHTTHTHILCTDHTEPSSHHSWLVK